MTTHPQAPEYRFADYLLLPQQRLLLRHGEVVRLGARAFDVLLTLIESPEHMVSKQAVIETVWPAVVVEENNLHVQISSLRKLLGADAIITIPRYGYRFNLPVEVRGMPQGAYPQAPGNLPRHLPPLIGRDLELGELLGHLDRHGLVSVTGQGGMGKSQLAQAAAWHRRQTYPAGTWLVDLASIQAPLDLPGLLARVLGLPSGLSTAARLVAAMPEAEGLLLLDNCEQLSGAVAELASLLLAYAPQWRLLVTSQEPLRVPEEYRYRLGPLRLPPMHVPADQLDGQCDGAVSLFVARAQALQPDFCLSRDNLPLIVKLCEQLDGLPLALELAAGRMPLLGLHGLLDRLEQERFDILGGGLRTGLHRHHSLQASLAWSYQRLGEAERRMLGRLSVFTGTFNLEMALQVSPLAEPAAVVLDTLAALVDKSLLLAEGHDPPSYRLARSVRAYAMTCESGEAVANPNDMAPPGVIPARSRPKW
ncbi:MAG TPA: winged helix-turn-helix domain-containing protein [Chitinimonas sp.]